MEIYKLVGNKIKNIPFAQIDKRGLIWIRAINPGEEDIKQLTSISQVPIEELRETLEEEERPRLLKKKYIELIYDAPHVFKGEGLQTMEIYVYISGNLIITVEEENNKILDKLEAKCRAGRSKFMLKSHGAFLFHVLDEINDEFLSRIDRLARNTQAIKTKELTQLDIKQLYSTSISSAYFNQAIIANLEVLNQLRKCHHPAFTPQDRHNFNELYIDKLQILDTEKIQREMVMHMVDLQQILSAEKLNKTMKRLTAFALLIMVPTFVTGLYGMNINLPLIDHPHAFGIVMGIVVVLTVLLLVVFRKMDWI